MDVRQALNRHPDLPTQPQSQLQRWLYTPVGQRAFNHFGPWPAAAEPFEDPLLQPPPHGVAESLLFEENLYSIQEPAHHLALKIQSLELLPLPHIRCLPDFPRLPKPPSRPWSCPFQRQQLLYLRTPLTVERIIRSRTPRKLAQSINDQFLDVEDLPFVYMQAEDILPNFLYLIRFTLEESIQRAVSRAGWWAGEHSEVLKIMNVIC